ncbi:hypothetical protein IT41_15290 [Paracoccus halophilus]|nr:hypothetical protein IT41_15290 [Paracoccus halophilus]
MAMAVLIGAPASAEEWAPKGSLTLEIGFAAGGTTDVIGRVLAKVMEEQTGWNIVAENRTGGGGIAMLTGIAKRPPRGDVIGMGVNMPVLAKLATDPDTMAFALDDLDYLGTVASTPIVIVARKDAPFDDMRSMIDYSIENGPISIGFIALGQRLVMEKVARETGAKFNLVAGEGSSETMKLILGGQVQAGFSSGEHFPFEDAGDMKEIATTAPERVSWAPDAPTFIESGIDIFFDPVFFIATTKGTDPAAVAALSQALDAAVATDEVAEAVRNAIRNDPKNLGSEGARQMMLDGLENFIALNN